MRARRSRGPTTPSAGLDAAITTLTGRAVSIAQWGFDEFDYDPIIVGGPDARGFQVIFNDTPSIIPDAGDVLVDVPALGVDLTGTDGFVGETSRDGVFQNDGVPLPQTSNVADNSAPVAVAPADKTIPVRTPFALAGSATDPDSDSLITSVSRPISATARVSRATPRCSVRCSGCSATTRSSRRGHARDAVAR